VTPGALPNLIVAGLVAGLALFVSLRRPPPALWPTLLLYPLCGVATIAGFVLSELAPEPWSHPVGSVLVYSFAMVLVALSWVIAVRYAEAENRPFWWAAGPWFAVPLIATGIAWLMAVVAAWQGRLPPPASLAVSNRHWVWYALAGVAAATNLAAIGAFAALARGTRDDRVRRNATVMASGLFACVVLGGAAYSGLRKPLVHPTVVGIGLTSVLFLWGAYRTRWFTVLSAAIRETLRHDPDGVALVDVEGRWLHSNPAATALLGSGLATRDLDVVTLIANRVRRADGRAIERAELAQALLHPDDGGGELGPVQLDGSRWLAISSAMIFSRRRVPLAVSLRLHDVTQLQLAAAALRRNRDELEQRIAARTAELQVAVEGLRGEVAIRKGVESKLMQSRERHRAIAEVSSDLSFAFVLDPEGGITWEWISRAVTGLTGYDFGELGRLDWHSIVHPDDRARVVEEHETLRRGDPVHLEVRILTKPGITRWLELHIRATRDSATDSMHAVGAVRDVTERRREQEQRRRLEQKVRETQRLESLGVLAGGIAHDFNNLLTVISGNAALANSELASPDALQKRLQRIRAAADYAVALTDQILTYAGKPSLRVTAFDIRQLVTGMLDLLRASVSPDCRIETDLHDDLSPVEGDTTQIRQVIMNLVTNASEALGATGGRIFLRTGQQYADSRYLGDSYAAGSSPRPGTYVYVEVSDDGPGIDIETQQRIFEPFFSTKFSGRGLGLAAVHGIVQAHGGVIKLTSTPGVATKFRVLLPCSERAIEATVGAAASVASPPEAAAGSRVLVVDDDEAVLHLAREFLERAGFRILTASGGEEALRVFRDRCDEIDAIVLDLSMPDVDGEQTFLEIRRMRPDVPVLVVSGFSEEMAAENFPATSGSARFLAKPYQAETLVAQIREALSN